MGAPTILRASILVVSTLLAACATNTSVPASTQAAKQQPNTNTVRIVRDDYGVPHIYADTVFGLFYGYGYAVAQDRLFQMEMARRSTQGTVAEVLGPDFIDYDRRTRQGFNPASIRQQLAALSADDGAILAGYAAGINGWLREVRANPDHYQPLEFTEHDFSPADWSDYDVAMVFVGTMANRYADFNTELENSAILQSLTDQHGADNARRIFDSLNPRLTTGAPTTISAEDWQAAASPVQDLQPSLIAAAAAQAVPTDRISGFSNCVVLGPEKSTGADAILVNGPQFGWFVPAYVYSVGLHGAGFDVVGNTPFAYPILLFGHNGKIGWGSTWGAGDIVDIYAEQVDPQDSARYRAGDQWLTFDTRSEAIKVRGQADQVIEVARSRHGPIIARDTNANVAFAKQRSWRGRELETLLAWVHSMRAHNYEEWVERAEAIGFNINLYYADVEGNIGYAFTGRYPQRAPGHDNRLPAPGGGTHEWLGRQPFAQANPHSKNPTAGYLANWNNKPAPGVLNPDEFWYSWSSADRVDYLHDQIKAQPRFTPDQAWDLLPGSSSYADVNAPYFLHRLEQAVAGNNELQSAFQILRQWDLQSRDRDQDSHYDEPATVLFRSFLGQLIETVLADDLGDSFKFFAATGYPTSQQATAAGTNIQTGTKAVVEALNGNTAYDFLNGRSATEIVREAFAATVEQVRAAEGSDPQTWRLLVAPRPFSNRNFLGVPQAPERSRMIAPLEQNRGTENNMFVFADGQITGYEVTPPGQSGFINRAGERSPHYTDQFALYYEFGRKRMWFTPQEVQQAKTQETIVVTE